MQWSHSPQLKHESESYPASYVDGAVNVDDELNVDGDGGRYDDGDTVGAGSHHEGGKLRALAGTTGSRCSTGVTVKVLVRGSSGDCARAVARDGCFGRRKSNSPACAWPAVC